MKRTCLLILVALMATGLVWAQTTIHYWSFNVGEPSELDAANNLPTSILADIGDGVINHTLVFAAFAGSTVNAEPGYIAGAAFCPETVANIGESFEVVFSTEGYENIWFSFAGRKTTTGYNNNTIEVSTDGGISWVPVITGLDMVATTTLALYQYDLTGLLPAVDDSSEVIVRVTLDVDGVTGAGNNRYDNVKVTGDEIMSEDQVLTPYFVPGSGEYYPSVDVEILCDTPGAVIYYSAVGDEGPWEEYLGLINISTTTTIWAYATAVGMIESYVASETYTIPVPATTTIPFVETFDTDLGDLYVYTVTGSNPWHWLTSSARCNGFGGQPIEEHWLVLPGINFDLYDDLLMSFTNYARYGDNDDNNYLKLFYSSNYPGVSDPYAPGVIWTELTFDQPTGAIGSTEIQTASGIIDLSAISGDSVFLAFKYYSTNSPTAWRVDDILIEEAPEMFPVADPTFSPAAGTYYEPQLVAIQTATEDAAIYYRFDVEDPWTVYVSELSIVETTTIWAYAAKAGMLDSEIVTATYIITEPPVEPELISYWNFNNPPASGNWPQPILPYIGPGEIIYTFTEAVSFTGTILNGIEGEVSGGSFVPRPHTDLINNGEHFDIIVPTTGYEDIVLSYATQRTATGFNSQQVLYSINGIDFIEIVTFTDIPTSWAVRTVDFSEIAEVNDNPYFIIRIVLDGGTGTTGNNRFDNIRIMGFEIDEPPLPVVLSSFTANWLAGEFVELQWISETESNMLGYNVYRNIDNSLIESEKINPTVIPAYNTSNQQVYNYVDEDVLPEVTYYYWLQIVDLDLTHNFYGPISVLTGWGDDPGTPPGIEYVTRLHGAYPNPFNPGTNIRYELAEPASVTIVIYNARGQYVATLEQGALDKGIHSLFWNGLDERGNASTSGIYFYHFRTSSGYEKYEKMMLLK